MLPCRCFLYHAILAQLVEHHFRKVGVPGSIPGDGSFMEKNFRNYWDHEYQHPTFLTLGTEPLADVKEFLRTLRRKKKIDMTDWIVLDLGCGNGKNLIYAVENFCASGIGYDISPTAIDMACIASGDLPIHYEVRSIGELYPLADHCVDLIIDTTSSHCLSHREREIYLREIMRVLKPDGWLFVRTLCLDGDKNAKQLLQQFPGKEPQTYVLPNIGITETVFTEQQIKDMYTSTGFTLDYFEKSSGYQKWGNQSYKRNYVVVWYTKKS